MRVPIIKNLHQQMYADLEQIRDRHTCPSQRAEHSIPIVQQTLLEVKKHILTYPFKWRSEEIWFFKYVKPTILCELIFNIGIFNFYRNSPILREYQLIREFWYQELKKIRQFYERNESFCEYLALDKDWLDVQFFVRRPGNAFFYFGLPKDLDPVTFYGDPDFSTSHDYRAANYYANIRLEKIVRQQLVKVEKLKYLPAKIKEYKGNDQFTSLVWYKVGAFLKSDIGKAASQNETIEYLDASIDADLANKSVFEEYNDDEDAHNAMRIAVEKLRIKIEAENEDVEYDNDEAASFKDLMDEECEQSEQPDQSDQPDED